MGLLRNLRERLDRLTGCLMARCRVCGSRGDVVSFDPRGLWAFFFRQTWCPDHCPDHDYVYSRYDGHYCNNCGQPRPDDYYED